MKHLLRLLACIGIACAASDGVAQPAPPGPPLYGYVELPSHMEQGEIALRPEAASRGPAEQWYSLYSNLQVRNVVRPTLTPILPAPGKATGAAVIVAPGGAFTTLPIENEGYRLAHWLADRGIAAFVLKYRTGQTTRDPIAFMARSVTGYTGPPVPVSDAEIEKQIGFPPDAAEDGSAAIRLVRARAAQWGVDPHRVGWAGFSAGAMIALSLGLGEDSAVRPDFMALVYAPMWARPVPEYAPPAFVAIALDDPLFAHGRSLGLIDSWRKANRPIEAHLFEKGGHGFGAAGGYESTRLWMDSFYAWMKDRGLLVSRATGEH